jgi:hypothetical protein
MNFLSGIWAGTISGTNVGSFTLEIEDRLGKLSGILRLTESSLGLFVYDCIGDVRDNHVGLETTPRVVPEGVEASHGKVSGRIQPDGSLTGEWSTEQGASGTLIAFKRSVPSGHTAGLNAATAPAMVFSSERHTRVKPCVVDVDVLRRIHRELSTASDEAARLEFARQTQLSTAPPAANVPSQKVDYAQVRSVYSVMILAKGVHGEQVVSLDPSVLDGGHLPKPLASIQFDIGSFYQFTQNRLAPNRTVVRLDFTRPPVFDISNVSLLPTPNDSMIQVIGNDSMWVSGVHDKMVTTLRHGRVRSAWVHSRYTYDALLLMVGLPASLAAASLIGGIVSGSPLKQLAGFLFSLYLSLLVFRLAFGIVRWLLPTIEFSGLPQPLDRQIRFIISTVVLGALSSLAATLVWLVFTTSAWMTGTSSYYGPRYSMRVMN